MTTVVESGCICLKFVFVKNNEYKIDKTKDLLCFLKVTKMEGSTNVQIKCGHFASIFCEKGHLKKNGKNKF